MINRPLDQTTMVRSLLTAFKAAMVDARMEGTVIYAKGPLVATVANINQALSDVATSIFPHLATAMTSKINNMLEACFQVATPIPKNWNRN